LCFGGTPSPLNFTQNFIWAIDFTKRGVRACLAPVLHVANGAYWHDIVRGFTGFPVLVYPGAKSKSTSEARGELARHVTYPSIESQNAHADLFVKFSVPGVRVLKIRRQRSVTTSERAVPELLSELFGCLLFETFDVFRNVTG
jgi:hypothetical protein